MDLLYIWLCFNAVRIPVGLNTCLLEKPSMVRRSWAFITGSSSISKRKTITWTTKDTRPEITRIRYLNLKYIFKFIFFINKESVYPDLHLCIQCI